MLLSVEEINVMLVNQLKDELKARGAPTAGKKAELAARLAELVAQEGSEQSENSVLPEIKNEIADLAEVRNNNIEVSKGDVIAAAEEDKTGSQGTSTDLQSASDSHSSSDVVSSQPAAIDSEILHVVANETQIATSDVPRSGYTHVRIDNFQRPLTQKALTDWLEAQVGCKLATDAIWINSIKTHCYVDFSTEEEATRCVETVTGKKYPISSPYLLEADFTSVSAKEAPESTEGNLKPGSWKVVPSSAVPASSPAGNKLAVVVPEENEAMEITENTTTTGPSSSNLKRKHEDAAGSPTASATATTPSNKAQRVAGLDIFRRATAGILLGRPAGSNAVSAVYEAPKNIARPARDEENDAYEASTQDKAEQKTSEGGVSLEDLFRKTTTATPALYWMPAPDEVVQQRLKSRLLSKNKSR
eukprot:gene12874-14859_t